MKQKTRGVGVGTISLIMIFAVLCLTVFAMLTLSTSNAEKVLADRTSSFVKSYYEADSQATQIKADLLASYAQSGATGIETYSCRINDVQDLLVKIRFDGGSYTVLEWKTGYSQEWELDTSIAVMDIDALFAELSVD
jgi:hypothetical protein